MIMLSGNHDCVMSHLMPINLVSAYKKHPYETMHNRIRSLPIVIQA